MHKSTKRVLSKEFIVPDLFGSSNQPWGAGGITSVSAGCWGQRGVGVGEGKEMVGWIILSASIQVTVWHTDRCLKSRVPFKCCSLTCYPSSQPPVNVKYPPLSPTPSGLIHTLCLLDNSSQNDQVLPPLFLLVTTLQFLIPLARRW